MACGHPLEEPAGATHYQRLALQVSMNLDADALETNFLRLSRLLHPDFHGGAQSALQQLVLRNSALLNEAHDTLARPAARAEYLLALHDPDVLEQHKQLDPAFLLESMELSESIEEARDGSDDEALQRLAREVGERIDARMDLLQRTDSWDPPDLGRLAIAIHELKVFRRMLRATEPAR